MPEAENQNIERVGKNATKKISDLEAVASALSARVVELERTVTALLKGMQAVEEEQGDAYMPIGNYFGVQFDE